jgi:ribosomal-protein-alanine N-acetyltransferase
MKAILFGNGGAGKSTLAKRLIARERARNPEYRVALLPLDEIAWNPGMVRKPADESLALLRSFIARHEAWIIEGVYGDLIEAALPHCGELHFLNPGVEACVAHCYARPWEPDKFATKEMQDAMLEKLVDWVKQYPDRDDEFGLKRHRALFDTFSRKKREYTATTQYTALEPIETKRLRLRPLTREDAGALYDIFSSAAVMRYWSTGPWTGVAQAEKKIASILDGYESGEHFTYGIERKEDGQVIGTCALFNFVFPSRRADIGYALGEAHWAMGYMHEAMSAWVRHAFETLNLHRLEADIDPRNAPSAKTLERQGFVREGFLRERWIVGGEVSDTALYGLLANDWREAGLGRE